MPVGKGISSHTLGYGINSHTVGYGSPNELGFGVKKRKAPAKKKAVAKKATRSRSTPRLVWA